MLTVSLHGIRLYAPVGLYAEEHILGNVVEIDVDIWLPVTSNAPWPFVDYTVVRSIVATIFQQPAQLLETLVQNIHTALKQYVPAADKIKVAVKKLHPPMPGEVQYAMVCFEG
jgi:dihydroneopterin aldolase